MKQKRKLTGPEKLAALPAAEKLALIKGIQANDERILQYYYRNFVDKTVMKKGRSMDQFAYMLARQSSDVIANNRGSDPDYDKYLFNKAYADAALA